MSSVGEGLETPIDNFVFRQCPAEFKLKATNSINELPSWSSFFESTAPKASLVQISHKNGLIMFPYHEKGALGFSGINNLAEKENLPKEFLTFPGDESFITAMCLDPSERLIYVAKASNKLYAVDLSSESKRPFVKRTAQMTSKIVECVASDKHELFVLFENGKILNLTTRSDEILIEIDLDICSIIKSEISCMSLVRNNLMAIGSKKESKIYLINLENTEISFKSFLVPFEALNCGSKGIYSIFLFEDEKTLLFSCKPEDPESDDVPLLLIENISEETCERKFYYFFDPCASRPPRQNQFYFQTLPISKWADNLVDLVVVGNFSSPDLGICGRLSEGGEFYTFYIDNDEGLAQLPFVNGEVTYPLGLALDLSSKTPLDNLKDPEGEKYPAAPIIWVLTNNAQLCPFSMVKTDETKPFTFMISVPDIRFSSNSSSVEVISSEELESFSSEEEDEVSEKGEKQSQTPPQKTITAAAVGSTPQTPSKVPLQQLASLQKSAEIQPIEKKESSSGLFSFKIAPVEPVKPLGTSVNKPASLVSNQPVITSSTTTAAKTQTVVDEPVPALVKKEEKMETINVSAYQNILLAEIAATHAAMQEDLFSLKQISLKNSLLLRQNSQKYFNSLESLESYAVTLEKLLSSSDKVFLGVKDRLDGLKFDLKELMGRMKQIKGTWNRIKQDNKINWEARVKALSTASEDLFERIERLRNFMSNPIEASKYRATLKSFVDSTQEKVQLLMAHLSNLFVCQNEDISAIYADLGCLSLSPSLSSDSLLDQLNVLSLDSSRDSSLNDSKMKTEKRNKSLLNAAKARGARLLIPTKFTPAPTPISTASYPLKLSPEDENLISSFISAINLTEEVPEFAETAVLAKLSLEDKVKQSAVDESKSVDVESVSVAKSVNDPKTFEIKPVVSESKPFEFKPAKIESKPFEFKPTSSTAESKPFEFKTATNFSESKPFDFKPTTAAVETKPFAFKPLETKTPETVRPVETAKPFEFKPLETKESEQVKSVEPKLFSFNNESKSSDIGSLNLTNTFSFKAEEKKVTSESSSNSSNEPEPDVLKELKSPVEEPKIPSIFTVGSQPAATEHTSVLKKESPLPSFDSLNFGSSTAAKKEEESSDMKPFPAIFGVKTVEEKDENVKTESTKSESTTSFGFLSPTPVFKEKKEEPATAFATSQGFAFGFNPEASKEQIKEPVVKEQSTASATPAAGFAFNFAPTADKSPSQPASSGFSITTKPTFGAPTAPVASASVFGSSSMPAPPVFGSTSLPAAPAFGQTSLPSFGFNAPAVAPTAPTGSTGFAAFAAASGQGSTGFSAFSAPQGSSNGNGLTFASFLPADKDKKKDQQQQQGSGSAPSSFSFTGFRE